jgi:hypothetical protein
VGSGVGALIVTVPALSASSNLSRLIASIATWWLPTGSRPDQRNVTPRFQSSPAIWLIAWVSPATRRRTQSAGEPSRFRYATVTTIAVAGVPESGDSEASNRRVGPEPAHTGTTVDSAIRTAAIDATIRAGHRPPVNACDDDP